MNGTNVYDGMFLKELLDEVMKCIEEKKPIPKALLSALRVKENEMKRVLELLESVKVLEIPERVGATVNFEETKGGVDFGSLTNPDGLVIPELVGYPNEEKPDEQELGERVSGRGR